VLPGLSALVSLPFLLSAQTYEVSASKNVMITARDGIKLGTDVYRPAQNGSPV